MKIIKPAKISRWYWILNGTEDVRGFLLWEKWRPGPFSVRYHCTRLSQSLCMYVPYKSNVEFLEISCSCLAGHEN